MSALLKSSHIEIEEATRKKEHFISLRRKQKPAERQRTRERRKDEKTNKIKTDRIETKSTTIERNRKYELPAEICTTLARPITLPNQFHISRNAFVFHRTRHARITASRS